MELNKKIKNIKIKILLTILGIFLAPAVAFAVVRTLNGQAGQIQLFANDSNLTIASVNDVHSLVWNGVLPVSRGGTGQSAFNNDSIIFFSSASGSFSSAPFIIDESSPNNPAVRALNGEANEAGHGFGITAGLGNGIGRGGPLELTAGDGGVNGNGGPLGLGAGTGQGLGQIGGDVIIEGGPGVNGATAGHVQIRDPQSGSYAQFITSSLSDNRDFTFPDSSGTFGLLETNQIFSGLNKFEATNNSTIYVGSALKTGCIVLGDSDGDGVTYITANNGVLSATAAKPSICQ